MKLISLTEHHQILLEMLQKVDAFCRENSLRYSLGGGTLLGAIRHQGFIPWDDDVDIMMPRPDYNRFISEFQDKDDYCLCFEKDRSFWLPYAKLFRKHTILKEKNRSQLTQIFIDIFPIDAYPDDSIDRKRYIRRVKLLQKLRYLKSVDFKFDLHRWRRTLVKVALFFVPQSVLTSMAIKTSTLYSYEGSQYLGAVTGRYGSKECYERTVFDHFVDVRFENVNLMMIKQYDVYLRQHYGDYLRLPPENKRVVGHAELVAWE